jgi:hypothetical protein
VSDEHAWASYLSRILNERAAAAGYPFRIEVVNYGRGFFYPTQETVLLEDLLRSGHRPSLVIFMDGLNLGPIRDQPIFKPQIARAFIERQLGARITRADVLTELRWVPMVRLALSLNGARTRADTASGSYKIRTAVYWQDRVRASTNAFEQGEELARADCELYGCRAIFFLQPDVFCHYSLDLYRRRLLPGFVDRVAPVGRFYDRVRADRSRVDLSMLFEQWGKDRKAVIDDMHHSPGFNEFLAERVAVNIRLDSLRVFDRVVVHSAATRLGRTTVTTHGMIRPPSDDGPDERASAGGGLSRWSRSGSPCSSA